MVDKGNKKGALMEEALRSYFNELGYFSVRSVPFTFEGFDVTDVDLWVYTRSSSVSRELAIVDIKNKSTPKAIERIFWTSGLMKALSVDQAIVATSDKRPAVRDFGQKMNVIVLDGNFTAKLKKKYSGEAERLSEEEFLQLISESDLGPLDGDWKSKYLEAKSLFTHGLSFDVCNNWLIRGQYFAEQIVARPGQREAASRMTYLFAGFICICIDFIMKDLAFNEPIQKKKILTEGFTYGSSGASGTQDLLNASLSLVSQFAPNGDQVSNVVRSNVHEEFSKLPSNILSDFFGKGDIARSLFATAKGLEALAFQKNHMPYAGLSPEFQSVLGALFDFWGIDRKSVLDACDGK